MNKIASQLHNIVTEFNELVVSNNEVILNMLYTALADEWLAYFQYWAAANSTFGKGKTDVDPQFIAHAEEELAHADKIIKRIKELGGKAIPRIDMLKDFCSVPNAGAPSTNPIELLGVTIKAEEDAINFYKELQTVTKGSDPTTNRMVKQILEDEEEHLYDLKMLLADISAE